VHDEPTALDRQLHARAVLCRCALVLKQERAVDLLDMDAAILHRLDGAGDLDQAARGLLGIGIGAVFSVFHAVMCAV
jgi:hypothetical protein